MNSVQESLSLSRLERNPQSHLEDKEGIANNEIATKLFVFSNSLGG